MDFGIIYQLKTKKFWWLDTILYFVVALLLATVFCFLAFNFRISIEDKKLAQIEEKISQTGTAQQKELEKQVFDYQRKIDNFATLLNAHKLPTNLMQAIERITLPNVWFDNFAMDADTAVIRVTGEAESVPTLSRQVEIIEGQELFKEVSDLSFEMTQTGRVSFNFSLALDPKIFFDLPADLTPPPALPNIPVLETVSPSTSLFLNPSIF